jgi:hypothetical protein
MTYQHAGAGLVAVMLVLAALALAGGPSGEPSRSSESTK